MVTPLLFKDRLYFWGGLMLSRDRRDYAREHPEDEDYPPGDARKYAEITGGFPFQLRDKKVEERLAEIIDSLRARYTIGYRPAEEKPAGTFCGGTGAGRAATPAGVESARASRLLPEVVRPRWRIGFPRRTPSRRARVFG